jgi:anion-transporting  ArsA/GET3 family ATPase
MDVEAFCSSSKVVIVAGKGGVGKTTVAATLAVVAARVGMDVVIVEVEGKSGLSAMFDRPPLGYDEMQLAPRIRGRTLTPEDAMLEYLDTHGLRRVSKRLVKSGASEIIATAVPGLKDVLVLGKVKSIEKHGGQDLVIVDGPAAGHAITFLTSAAGLLDAIRVGPVRRQAADVMDLLSDPARCRTMLVTLAEETPVNEMVETAFALEDRVGVSLTPIVVNGLYPGLNGSVEGAPVTPGAVGDDGEAAGVFVSEREQADLAAAAEFHRRRHELQQGQVERLATRLPLRQVPLPNLARTEMGPGDLDTLADAFAAGIDTMKGEP